MPKDDDKKSKKDDKPVEKKRKGNPFILGTILGLSFGVMIGWWTPVPKFFESIISKTNKEVKSGTEKAKSGIADVLDDTADSLRE